MSIRAIQAVWDHSAQQGSRLLLMLALADYANDDGISWPKLATLAQKCRCSRGYIKGMLGDLKAAGEIEVIERRMPEGGNLSNWYRLLITDAAANTTCDSATAAVTPVTPLGLPQ